MDKPFEGGLGSYKLYLLLGKFLKYYYKGEKDDAGAMLLVRRGGREGGREGGKGSYKLYLLLGKVIKYYYKGDKDDAGAVLLVRRGGREGGREERAATNSIFSSESFSSIITKGIRTMQRLCCW